MNFGGPPTSEDRGAAGTVAGTGEAGRPSARERLTIAPSPCSDADAERVCAVTHLLLAAERMATPQGREAVMRLARAIAHGKHTDAFATLQPPMENRHDSEEAAEPSRRSDREAHP